MSVQDGDILVLLDGVWTIVDLLQDPMTIRRGGQPFGGADAWPTPTEARCTINDDELDYDPSLPTSLLYGLAGRNTPVRIRPQRSTRVYLEAESWAPSRTSDHIPGDRVRGRAEVALTAKGLLGRLEQWTQGLDSPMFRTNSSRSTSLGHWSLEDDKAARVLGNSLPSGRPGVYNDAELGDDNAPLGARQSMRTSASTGVSGTFVTASSTAGWQVYWSFNRDELPSSATYELFFRVNASNGYTYYFDINSTSYRMNVTAADGTNLTSQNYFFGEGAEPTKWVTMRIKVEQSGGNVNWSWGWYSQELQWSYVPTGSFAGTVGAVRSWRIPGTPWTEGMYYSHVGGVTGGTDALTSFESRRVFNGYIGERALTRYYRLMSENNLTRFGIGSESESVEMGPQSAGTLIENLRQIRATEDGDISDERFTPAATTMRTRRSTYNQAVSVALDFPGHVKAYTKVIGAEGAWNVITVKNARGGEYVAAREDGPMSTAASPDGIGEVRRQVDVSVDDERLWLPMIASWHLAKGTLEGARYTSITVNLDRHADIRTDCLDVREGDLITVDGLEPDLLRLLVVGLEERVTAGTWEITYFTEPFDLYRVGIWDDAGFVWGTNLSALDGDHTSTDNTLALTTPSRYGIWSTAFTGDLIIAGERVTVTSMGAATGTGPFLQTATVTRSANGIVKALPGGSKVMLFDNRRWGL